MSEDLATPKALAAFELLVLQGYPKISPADATDEYPIQAICNSRLDAVEQLDKLFGLTFMSLKRSDLRIRPKSAIITEAEIEAALARRKEARANKDFAASDAIRDELIAKGVEVMDGDPLGWDWRIEV
jgi:cysteinyl-tRNA synthetase